MPVITMKPEDVLKAIEGYENELDPERKALEAFYRQFRCKACGGAVRKELNKSHAFADPGTLTARALLRCTVCNCLFDPHSGLVLELGNAAKTPEDIRGK